MDDNTEKKTRIDSYKITVSQDLVCSENSVPHLELASQKIKIKSKLNQKF